MQFSNMFKNFLTTVALSVMFGSSGASASCNLNVIKFEFVDHMPKPSVVISVPVGGHAIIPANWGKFNIRAVVDDCVDSFLVVESNDLRGVSDTCEEFAPYTIFGDPSSSDLTDEEANYGRYGVNAKQLTKGRTYTASGCAWDGPGCTGNEGRMAEVTYMIV
jgi:hypothetical protein